MNSSQVLLDQQPVMRRALLRLLIVIGLLLAVAGVVVPQLGSPDRAPHEAAAVATLADMREAVAWHFARFGSSPFASSWDGLCRRLETELYADWLTLPEPRPAGEPWRLPRLGECPFEVCGEGGFVLSPAQLATAPRGICYVQSTGEVVLNVDGCAPSGTAWRDY